MIWQEISNYAKTRVRESYLPRIFDWVKFQWNMQDIVEARKR